MLRRSERRHPVGWPASLHTRQLRLTRLERAAGPAPPHPGRARARQRCPGRSRVEGKVVSGWTQVEVYATFMKLTGEMEVARPDRLSDVVNHAGRYLSLRDTRAEPLSVNYPVLSRVEPRTIIAKSAVILLCPVEEPEAERSPTTRRKQGHPPGRLQHRRLLPGRGHPPGPRPDPPGAPRGPPRRLPAPDQRLGAVGARPLQRDEHRTAPFRAAQPGGDPQLLGALSAGPAGRRRQHADPSYASGASLGEVQPPSYQMLERFILSLRNDFGCLCIIVGFLIVMIASIAFADFITPPAATPFT